MNRTHNSVADPPGGSVAASDETGVRAPKRSGITRTGLRIHAADLASALLASANSSNSRGEFDSFAALVTDEAGRSVMPTLLSSIQTNSNLSLVLRWRGMRDEATDAVTSASPAVLG